MGDGNTYRRRVPHVQVRVGTAVNPHGGWKRGLRLETELPVGRVGTAVNPHGGWKLFSPREGGEENRLGRPLILMGDGNKKFGYHEALPPRWDGR